MKYWQKLKYKNLTLLLLSFLAVYLLANWPPFQELLFDLRALGLLGAFIGGILFVFTFTVALGAVILASLGEVHPVWAIAVVAGLGSLLGDLIIFRFIRDRLLEELRPLYERLGGENLTQILHKVYLRWTLPVLGALIVASPLPDELGVTLMGISNISPRRFAVLSYVLNTLGIFALLGLIALL